MTINSKDRIQAQNICSENSFFNLASITKACMRLFSLGSLLAETPPRPPFQWHLLPETSADPPQAVCPQQFVCALITMNREWFSMCCLTLDRELIH